jgi:hypothetical protein
VGEKENEMNPNGSPKRNLADELEATGRLRAEADSIAWQAMSRYRWERRGLLGRLVRTPLSPEQTAPTVGLRGAA